MEEDDESKTEKFDEGKRGGAEPEINEAKENHVFLWELQCFAEDEPSEETLERVCRTKEAWGRGRRIINNDEPRDEDLKLLGMSREDGLELKRDAAYMNAFGVGSKEKIRNYWNAFRYGCKGRMFQKWDV